MVIMPVAWVLFIRVAWAFVNGYAFVDMVTVESDMGQTAHDLVILMGILAKFPAPPSPFRLYGL